MIAGFHFEVLYTAGYAVVLVGVAFALELLARRSHKMAEQMRVVGFSYHPELDVWKCPTGQHLGRRSTNENERWGIVVYQAPAHVCHVCHCKPACTDSDEGRQIEHHLDSWLKSELRRFHRGLSLLLLLLAGLLLAFEMRGTDTRGDWLVLWALVVPILLLGGRLLSEFLATERKQPHSSAIHQAVHEEWPSRSNEQG